MTELDNLYKKSRELENELAFLEINVIDNVVSVDGDNIFELIESKRQELYDINIKISKF